MFPFVKVFSLVVKTFTKPVINKLMIVTKNNQLKNENNRFSKFFIHFGKIEYNLELYINRKIKNIKTENDLFNIELPTNKLLERGIEFFYEIMIYFIIIMVGIYELHKNSKISKLKEVKEIEIFSNIDTKIETFENTYFVKLDNKNQEIENLKKKLDEIKPIDYKEMSISQLINNIYKIQEALYFKKSN